MPGLVLRVDDDDLDDEDNSMPDLVPCADAYNTSDDEESVPKLAKCGNSDDEDSDDGSMPGLVPRNTMDSDEELINDDSWSSVVKGMPYTVPAMVIPMEIGFMDMNFVKKTYGFVDSGLMVSGPPPSAVCCEMHQAERRNEVAVNVVKALLDSALTCHLKQDAAGIDNIKSCNKPIDSVNKGCSFACKQGEWKFQADGGTTVSLSNMYIMENFLSNIMSLPCLLEKGCKVDHVDQDCIMVGLPDSKDMLTFNQEDDGLYYMEMHPIEEDAGKVMNNRVAAVSNDEEEAKPKKVMIKEDSEGKEEEVNINQAHELLGHPGEMALHVQAKAYHWQLTSTLLSCDSCAKAKATAKSTVKQAMEEKKATKPGEHIFWDTSGPYKKMHGKNQYFGLLVDEVTDQCWVEFSKSKDEFADCIEPFFEMMKVKGHLVCYWCMDNAGEAKAIEEICAKHGIVVEYTALNTLQYNHKVEQAFPTIQNMAYASLMSSGMSESEQMVNWAHAVDDVTLMRNLMPRGEWMNAYEPFGEKVPVKSKDLIKFGARGFMAKCNKIKAKWMPKAEEVIHLGYVHNHPSDMYVVKKKSNGQVVMTRDVKWDIPCHYRKLTLQALEKAVAEAECLKEPSTTLDGNQFKALMSDSDNDSEVSTDSSSGGDAAQIDLSATVVSSRVARELKRLSVSMNDKKTGHMRRSTWHAEAVQNIIDGPPDPKDDKEAMAGMEREQWWDGTVTEYDGFLKLGTWILQKHHEV